MYPEYILFIYVVVLGIVIRIYRKEILKFVCLFISSDTNIVKKYLVKILNTIVVLILLLIPIWFLLNQYFFKASINTLMIGVSIITAIGVTIIGLSVSLINEIKKKE